MIRRRWVLFGGLAALLAGGGLAWRGALEARIGAALEAGFGPEVAGSEVARRFGEDLIARIPAGGRRALTLDSARWRVLGTGGPEFAEEVVRQFLLATNVVRAEEAGEGLDYLGLFEPYEGPCANPLTAMWL